MSQIVNQNPGSSEIQSPLIAGITEGLNRISSILNLKTGTLEDVQLTPVPIDDQASNKNRIYEANTGNRLWLSSPAPIFKKNGAVITQSGSNFSIDYIGGSITFPEESKPSDSDTITVSATYIIAESETLQQLNNTLSAVKTQSNKYKGNYDNLGALQLAYSSAQNGDFAIVFDPLAVYAWKNDGWYDTRSIEDLSNYYKKPETDNLLNQKEPKIAAKGSSTSDDNYYWGGRKSWQDFLAKVRATTLTGLSTASDAVVSATDTVLSALGKLQAQVSKATQKAYLSGTGAPTTSTAGAVGQRYVNTSNGDEYTCVSASGGTYTWKMHIKSVNGKSPSEAGSNVQLSASDVNALSTNGGNVNGIVKLANGYYVFDTTGTPGENGYINVATITINNTYQNAVIAFRFIRRTKKAPSTVFVSFQNQNTTDPNINQFIYSGDAQPSEFGLHKSSPGVWNLYVQKTEPYDDVAVTLLETCHGLMKTTISFGSEQVSSLPDESINPTYYNPASILETPVKIGNASFDGSKNITLSEIGALAANGTAVACSGNSATATKLATARKIGNASFNGAADITLAQIGAMPAPTFDGTAVDIKAYNKSSNPYTTPSAGWVTIGSAVNSAVAIVSTNYPYTGGYLATAAGGSGYGGIATVFVPAGAKIYCEALSGSVDRFTFVSAI